MKYAIIMFVILMILFAVAIKLINIVYDNGHRIWSILVGLMSFILLIVGTITLHNQVALTIIQIIFMFGTIVFFVAFTRNYKLYLAGKGKGWIADRTRKIQELNKKHNH